MQRLLVKAKQRRRRKGEPLSLVDGMRLGLARIYIELGERLTPLKGKRAGYPLVGVGQAERLIYEG